jgi:two-component system, chemotaxis family, chemotaxis protein CheY
MFPKNTKILIVDDMAMFRQMVKQALTGLGFTNYQEFPDGIHAWTALKDAQVQKAPYELIISDWNMPKMKGIELLRNVRAESWGAIVPFVMLTGETEQNIIMDAIKAGVTQYIVKPFTVDSLKDKLKIAYDKTVALRAAQPKVPSPTKNIVDAKEAPKLDENGQPVVVFVEG